MRGSPRNLLQKFAWQLEQPERDSCPIGIEGGLTTGKFSGFLKSSYMQHLMPLKDWENFLVWVNMIWRTMLCSDILHRVFHALLT